MFNKKRFTALTSLILSVFLFVGFSNLQAQDDTVVDVINNSSEHTIFAELVAESGMEQVITQPGPYTVIAPKDEAFEAMGSELDQLRENDEQLQSLVVSHLYQGEVPSDDVQPNLGIEVTEGDIEASNGLVHVTEEVVQRQ
jgi:uncharacterized surface protein with fasciclin (FAS1) repeats